MNMFKSVGAVTAIFITFAGATNAQSIYDQCITAIEAGDKAKVVELATTVKRLKYPGVNEKKAEKCLETAFETDFEIDYRSGEFVDSAAAAAIKQEKEERARRLAETKKLQEKISCHKGKVTKVDDLIKAQEMLMSASNKAVINNLTLRACLDLHKSNPFAAILNPICRSAFSESLHPDLEIEADQKIYRQLSEVKVNSQIEIIQLQAKIDAIFDVQSDKEGNNEYDDILADLMVPCD